MTTDSIFRGASILVTGGTGSFGKQCVRTLLERDEVRRVVVFSRDELKQFEMEQSLQSELSRDALQRVRYFIGDVRDLPRLRQAFDGIDFVIHAAALKQVPACEYNPFEAIKTNVLGAQNIISASIECGVKHVIALSTDKACSPINLYGATKLCSDKLFVAGNAYASGSQTRFGVVRYGNVVGSRGSVIPFFLKKRASGVLPITHPEMTRFWITLQQGVDFVLKGLQRMQGGELYVPKIPSMKVVDLARAIGADCRLEEVGIRPGEKLHEVMISEDDARSTVELDDCYVIRPELNWWAEPDEASGEVGSPLPPGFRYASDSNPQWLTVEELREMVAPTARSMGMDV